MTEVGSRLNERRTYMRPTHLSCFSPPVMIATFFIELGLMTYSLWRYKLNSVTRVSAAVFICLAVFQLAEYRVCEGAMFFDSAGWARVGHVAITLLPPLGIHLVAVLAKERRRWPYLLAYALGAVFAGYFLVMTNGITAGACLGNYVIFEHGYNTGLLYGIYYYGLLVATIVYAAWVARRTSRHVTRALYSLMMGYALFMVPTTFVNIVNPVTIAGIPSIMCGFAVLLALTIAFAVLPAYFSKK